MNTKFVLMVSVAARLMVVLMTLWNQMLMTLEVVEEVGSQKMPDLVVIHRHVYLVAVGVHLLVPAVPEHWFLIGLALESNMQTVPVPSAGLAPQLVLSPGSDQSHTHSVLAYAGYQHFSV